MIKTEIRNIIQRRTFGLVFVLGAASMAFAQERPAATQQKMAVTGRVQDGANNGIGYASITFKNKNNPQLSDAVLANVDGNFKIELAAGNYDVTIEAIDFKPKTQTIQVTKPGTIPAFVIQGNEVANLDKTTQIQGVVITAAAAKPYRVELDKKTYDPSQDIVSKGGNLQDVLSNVPSVSVDTDGTVSMRGSSNVKFLINGKPSSLLGIDDGANALQSIPADQIEKIEVITNPSSKFEASGTSGILNIILKKTKKVGFNGSVTGSLGYYPRTNLNTNLSWRKDKLTFFINGGGGYMENKNTNENDTYYNNVATIGDPIAIIQRTKNNSKGQNYNATTGLVYDISDKTSFNISGTVRSFENDSNGRLTYDYQNFQAINNFRNRDQIGRMVNLAFQGDVGVDHKFDDKGQNISLSFSAQRNRSVNKNDITEFNNNAFVLEDNTWRRSVNKTIIAKADYELPIGEYSKIEAGYRLDANNNDYQNIVNSTSNNPAIANYNNVTSYKETFNAIYAQFKSKIGEKFAYQLGLRNEHSKIDIDYRNLNQSLPHNSKSYNNIFPSVFLSYDLAKGSQFLVNYSKRIDRPRSFFMVPYPNYSDNQNIFEGNIDLNPSYVNSFEFGYSLQKGKITINPTLYYRHATDDTKMLVYRNDETSNVFYTKPINLGDDDRYGLDLNFTYDPFSWLKLMGSLDLFGYKTTGIASYVAKDINGNDVTRTMDFTGDGFSTRARLNSTFKLDKTFSIQLQGFFRGGQKSANQKTADMYALNLGASKTIWKGNGTITFNIQDIFNTRGREVFSYNSDYTRRSFMQFQPRQFSVSLSYRFRQGEKVEQPKRKKDINANATGGDDQQGPM
ncbi:TonB-dependent receptor domain-containing protein [Soonwooa purpurea]